MTEAQAVHALQKLTDKAIAELADEDKRFLVSEVRTQCLQGTIVGIFGLGTGLLAIEGQFVHSDLPSLVVDLGRFALWSSQLLVVISFLCAIRPMPLLRAKVEHRVLCAQPRLYRAYRRIILRRLGVITIFFMAYTALGRWLLG